MNSWFSVSVDLPKSDTGAGNIEKIAQLVGYADGVTLRTLLRRRLGKGIRELKIA